MYLPQVNLKYIIYIIYTVYCIYLYINTFLNKVRSNFQRKICQLILFDKNSGLFKLITEAFCCQYAFWFSVRQFLRVNYCIRKMSKVYWKVRNNKII